jgi:hypothetical protein
MKKSGCETTSHTPGQALSSLTAEARQMKSEVNLIRLHCSKGNGVPAAFLLIATKGLFFALVLARFALPPIDTPNGLSRADLNKRPNVISQHPAKRLVCLEVNAEYLCNIQKVVDECRRPAICLIGEGPQPRSKRITDINLSATFVNARHIPHPRCNAQRCARDFQSCGEPVADRAKQPLGELLAAIHADLPRPMCQSGVGETLQDLFRVSVKIAETVR